MVRDSSLVWAKYLYNDENYYFKRQLIYGIIGTILDTKNYGTILESGQLEPKYARELLDMGNLICVCLGHGDLDKQGIMKLCREHDTEKDWTYRISEEKLSANADKWDEKNRMLKVECPRYGIEYIDTSKDREKILQKILSRIGEKVEKREEEENER